MANILVLGAGAMGSAFCFPLADSGHSVSLVGTHLDRDWISSARMSGSHPKTCIPYPPGVTCFFHDQFSKALTEHVELIVLGVSSPGVFWAAEWLSSILNRPVPVLMLTKGLAVDEHDTIQILPDVLGRWLAERSGRNIPIGAVAGPCIAGELAARRETSVIITGKDKTVPDLVGELMAAAYYHVRTSADAVGVEACAALKNFFAIGVGWAQGQLETEEPSANNSLMFNPASALFSQSLREMEYLALFLGGESDSVHGLSGVGDLYVTCQAGRNSRLGRLLGTGLEYREARQKHMAGDTVEGADLALAVGPTIEKLVKAGDLALEKLPLTRSIIRSVCGGGILEILWEEFHR